MFLTRLRLDSSVTGEWVLWSPLIYQTHAGDIIEVPRGYTTDLFSIPRPVRWLFDTDGRGREASVIHDYIYTDLTHRYTRADADRIFREALEDLGVGWAARWTMWSGVRAGGRGNW